MLETYAYAMYTYTVNHKWARLSSASMYDLYVYREGFDKLGQSTVYLTLRLFPFPKGHFYTQYTVYCTLYMYGVYN
jgi:hypothetical protein